MIEAFLPLFTTWQSHPVGTRGVAMIMIKGGGGGGVTIMSRAENQYIHLYFEYSMYIKYHWSYTVLCATLTFARGVYG